MVAVVEKAKTVRREMRDIVEDAKRRSKPITAEIIWRLLTREVPEDSCKNVLSMMVRAHQITRVNVAGARASHYEPGPEPVQEKRGAVERFSMMMGNREHARLMAARKAAREWLRG